MHCSAKDYHLLGWGLGLVLLDLYMMWCFVSLWHEYAFGWTTTDPRFAMYLDPFACVHEEAWWGLAGGNPDKEKTHDPKSELQQRVRKGLRMKLPPQPHVLDAAHDAY